MFAALRNPPSPLAISPCTGEPPVKLASSWQGRHSLPYRLRVQATCCRRERLGAEGRTRHWCRRVAALVQGRTRQFDWRVELQIFFFIKREIWDSRMHAFFFFCLSSSLHSFLFFVLFSLSLSSLILCVLRWFSFLVFGFFFSIFFMELFCSV